MVRESPSDLEKLEAILRKFPHRNVEFYAKKLGCKKSKTYDLLSTLTNQERAYSDKGLWCLEEAQAKDPPTPAERYSQWRRTPEGGGNRFWAAMFPATQKRQKKQNKDMPIYVPQVKPRRLPEHIPNPDEIDEANRS